MPPGESSCPGGSENVWQRGIEGVLGRVTGGQNWPFFKKYRQYAMLKINVSPKVFKIEHANLNHFFP